MIAAILRCPEVDIGHLESHQVDLDVVGAFHRIGTKVYIIRHTVAWVKIFKWWRVRSDTRVMESEVRCIKLFWQFYLAEEAARESGS